MPSITLQFSAPLNTSCQVGDTVYYVQSGNLSSNGSFDTVNVNNIVEFGIIIDRINHDLVFIPSKLPSKIKGLMSIVFFIPINNTNRNITCQCWFL